MLYAQYGRTVSGLCGALLRNRVEAEDATQQTFLSAHRAILNGTDPREPAAWLATIARNECWGRIRMRMREPLPTDRVDTVSTAPDPLAEAIRRADLAALWRAIGSLPVQQRDALLLREFGGLSYDELAAALSVSGSAVESLLFRARQRLRAQLRTAYASLTGASWLEAVARVFAGGGAPVAAKVAALGVGAAAVSGGAVVAPQVFENHPRTPAPAHTAPAHTAPAHTEPHRPAPAAVVVPVAAPVRRVAAVSATTDNGGSRSAPDHESAGAAETRTIGDRGSGARGGGDRGGGDRGGNTAAQPVSGLLAVKPGEDSGDSQSGPGGGDSSSGGDADLHGGGD